MRAAIAAEYGDAPDASAGPMPNTVLLRGLRSIAYEAPDALRTLFDPRRLYFGDRCGADVAESVRGTPGESLLELVLRRAASILDEPPIELTWYGEPPRHHMLETSRDALRRISALAFTHRVTSEARYRDEALAIVRWCASLSTWNPPHFLDVAEMTHAVALGLCWLWDDIDESDRRAIADGIVRLGLAAGDDSFGMDWPHHRWKGSTSNWNLVCSSGLTIGALAVLPFEPTLAGQTIARCVHSLEAGLGAYEPDGGYPEGVTYWQFGTRYACFAISALRTTLGTAFGLGSHRPLLRSAEFPQWLRSPTGQPLAYGDEIADEPAVRTRASYFYLAELAGRPELAALPARVVPVDPEHVGVWDVLWFDRAYYDAEPIRPKGAKLFRGEVPVAVYHGAQDLFIGIKAGRNSHGHCNLDLGTVELHWAGVRWLVDLGRDGYDLPGYFQLRHPDDASRPGQRFDYFRTGTLSHNVPVMDGEHQRLDAAAVLAVEATPDGVVMSTDLSDAYSANAVSVKRRLEITDGERLVGLRDVIRLDRAARVRWQFLTRAEADADGPDTLVLRDGGRALRLRWTVPQPMRLSVEQPTVPPPNEPNPGLRIIALNADLREGEHRIDTRFSLITS